MQSFEELKTLIANVEADVAKHLKGNKSAGIRVRAAMIEVKKKAQDVRLAVLDQREAE